MTLIVVERSFPEPAVFEDLEAQEAAVGWCLQQHRVKALWSFASLDGKRAICVYEAPDAEAVRNTQEEGGLAYDHIWSAHLMEPPDRARPTGFSTVLVQRELPAAHDEEAAWGLYQASLDCMRRNRAMLWHSYLSLDGMRMICRYHAPDAEAVRVANLESQLPTSAIWPAKTYGDAES